jgi:hypothetical protein
MCVACGQELCKSCNECHNPECERYVEPSETCQIQEATTIVEKDFSNRGALCWQ